MSLKKIGLPIVLIIIALIMFNAFSQPGLNDFEASFEEIDLYRNENNTGPVERVYIVITDKENFDEMEKYAQLMPYSKFGNTKVYFFRDNASYPSLALSGDVNFDPQYNAFCLAKYERNFMGESLKKNPFK